ncbi:MAG: CHASE2 domain-containing protein [Rivularia sp. (in: cyanobacteria)]
METFELYLSPRNEKQFKAIVTQSGEADSSLPFTDSENDWRMTLLRTLEIAGFNPQYFSSHEQEWMRSVSILAQDGKDFDTNYLVYIGQALYRSLLPEGKVENAFKAALQLAESKNTQLHIQLRFEDNSSKRSRLADYPWELLHDGQYFLLHKQVTFSRYITHHAFPPNLSPVKQLNVLLVSSAAFDKELGLQKLSKREQWAIYEGLRSASDAGHIKLNRLSDATENELRKYLTEHQGNNAPHVVHFDGHGIFGKRCKNENCRTIHKKISVTYCSKCNSELPEAQGYLAFEDEVGTPDYVSAKELGALLQLASFADGSQTSGGVALVVLSACQSAMALEGESVFNGTAQNLINHRIPAVVAMQYSVNVDAATEFAKQFYRSLGQKNSLAVAISQGREAMGVEGNQWYRPVLYLRWKDNQGGQLFASPKSTVRIGIPFQAPPLPTYYVDYSKYIQNLKKRLLTNSSDERTLGVTAIHGLDSVGKSTIATAIAHDKEVQAHFGDGILWVKLGQQPDILSLLHGWVQALGDYKFRATSIETTSSHLRSLLYDKAVLLVVDDVWNAKNAQAFNQGGSRCQLLITTRKAAVATALGARIYSLDAMKPGQAKFDTRFLSNILAIPWSVIFTSITVSAGVCFFRFFGLFEFFELKIFDHLLSSRSSETQENRIVVIEATEADLKAQRERNESHLGSISEKALDEVLARLEQNKARIIAIDLYRDYETEPLASRFKQIKELFAICESPYQKNPYGIKPPSSKIIPPEKVGFSNFVIDRDGVLRRHLLEMPAETGSSCQSQKAFSFQVALRYLELENGKKIDYNSLWTTEGDFRIKNTLFKRINSYQYGGYQGIDSSGVQLILNYRAPKKSLKVIIPHFSLEKVRHGEISAQAFQNKIVLIGVTASSEAADEVQTPYTEKVAGVTIHAHMISQLLSAVLDKRALIWVFPQWGEALWIWTYSLAGSLLVYYCNKRWLLILLASGGLSTIYIICLLVMIIKSGWLPMLPPILTFIISGCLILLVKQAKNI